MAKTISLAVTGMKCSGCENNVKEKLGVLAGVISVSASSKDKQVTVEFDSAITNLQAIEEVITGSGFTVVND